MPLGKKLKGKPHSSKKNCWGLQASLWCIMLGRLSSNLGVQWMSLHHVKSSVIKFGGAMGEFTKQTLICMNAVNPTLSTILPCLVLTVDYAIPSAWMNFKVLATRHDSGNCYAHKHRECSLWNLYLLHVKTASSKPTHNYNTHVKIVPTCTSTTQTILCILLPTPFVFVTFCCWAACWSYC